MHYLDNNATGALDSRVLAAMMAYLERLHGNPSSLHRSGRAVHAAIEIAREQVAALVGANASQIIFTSGGTEANALAIFGSTAVSAGLCGHGATEHPSVLAPYEALRKMGREVVSLGVNSDGRLSMDALERFLDRKPLLLSAMWANNETGVVNDIQAISAEARTRGCVLHTDAVQACGRVPVNFLQSGASLLSISSHKLHGPQGVGALVMAPEVTLAPLVEGGGQERGMRGGTENVAGIVGFGCAAELARAELTERASRWRTLQADFEHALRVAFPDVEIFGLASSRLPNTVQFTIPGTDGETLLMGLDRKGIAVSSGSACASGAREPSHVLTAMGVPSDLALGAVRISLGFATQPDSIDKLIDALRAIVVREPHLRFAHA